MYARVIRPEIPLNRRVIAISDIHGNLPYLQGLLRKIDYQAGQDVLIIIGDIVERGEFNLETLRFVMQLAAEPFVYVLCGNCDVFHKKLWKARNDWEIAEYWNLSEHMLLGEMCKEICLDRTAVPHNVFLETIEAHFSAELRFLDGLPTILETEKYTFVHGGIPEQHIPLECLQAKLCMKNDAYLYRGLCFDKYQVVGHWPVTLYATHYPDNRPNVNVAQRICSIDGGCTLKLDGQLNALILPSIDADTFTFAAYDKFPVYHAAQSQAVSADWVFTKFSERQVRLLREGDEFSLVERCSDGKCFEAYNAFLFMYKGELCCDDYTDYRLPVAVGDELSVMYRTSRGTLCKKDGVMGWYDGTFLEEYV